MQKDEEIALEEIMSDDNVIFASKLINGKIKILKQPESEEM